MKQEDVNSSKMYFVEDHVTRNFVQKMYKYLFSVIAPLNILLLRSHDILLPWEDLI